MIKYLLATGSVLFLVAACLPANDAVKATKVSAPAESVSRAIVKANFTESEGVKIPSEINIPSSVGEVVFHHQMHLKDLGIKCAECHHQIDAKKLNTPHPDYLQSSWINCKICHDKSEKIKQNAFACSECHHTNPTNIADETLSAKVVIHKQCWKCHEVGTGVNASTGCEKCHSGKKAL
jgi:Zn finger protein HypA/HybF involved in hydrogenase expression